MGWNMGAVGSLQVNIQVVEGEAVAQLTAHHLCTDETRQMTPNTCGQMILDRWSLPPVLR
jgi:hypothetical protein